MTGFFDRVSCTASETELERRRFPSHVSLLQNFALHEKNACNIAGVKGSFSNGHDSEPSKGLEET